MQNPTEALDMLQADATRDYDRARKSAINALEDLIHVAQREMAILEKGDSMETWQAVNMDWVEPKAKTYKENLGQMTTAARLYNTLGYAKQAIENN